MNYKILLVDDENDILEFLSYNLEKEGFIVSTAINGKLAIQLAKKFKPDLIILDVMMPEMDGINTCTEIRKIPELENILILFLTARSEEYSELAGFDAGADDYVTKPIKPKLLISRINALLKRNKISEKVNNMLIGDIQIDKEKHLVLYKNEEIHLARKEFNLLYFLMSVPGKVFTREDIITEIWKDTFVGDRTIDVHIRKIREKTNNHHIKTVKGVGYKFDI
ncbi:MAG: response regulator transcription factor [Flavobacteriales bacterium]|jgi:two-component system alkaline phosphatase synthesis response regulator PhoP|nr:response regulator transcription factor [Flavobacteriales bacterium]|tara:strand:- start:3504 stop:4172 length:669 start_codon:yes stop_codon:yes gene_type:complete